MAATAKGHTPSKARQVMAAANRKAAKMNAETVARFYHPETVTTESYDRESAQWVDLRTSKYTYNKAGQVLTITDGGGFQLKYTYNEAGQLVKEESFEMLENEYKLQEVSEYTYDTVLKNFVVKITRTSYNVFSGESYGSNVNGTEITRNSYGNITKIQDYSEWDGNKNYEESLVIEYGADNKAVKITEMYGDEAETILTDIVWATTDGQITTFEYDDPNGEMYFSNNRIASATIDEGDSYPQPCKFTATYDGDSFHSKMMTGTDLALEIDFKCLEKFTGWDEFDQCYSYDSTTFEAEFEFDEDTNKYFIEYTDESTEENRTNAFGIQLSNKSVSITKYANPEYEDWTETDERKSEVTYDDTYGYPLTVIEYSTSYETGKLEPRTRINYSDYVNTDPSGVASVVVDSAAEAEYYTLQGVRIKGEPTPGLYICRKGNTATKVLVK
ncbi:MAG: hypothetical protein HDR80_06820 [Bacteroides sp.]|nr:hypothetical protein [Bacteroides sp.]